MSLSKHSVLTAIAQKNFLGSGSNACAYVIPDCDYVALIPRGLETESADGLQMEERPDPFPGHNFGQAVARLGNISICKRQRGLTPQSLGWVDVKERRESETDFLNVVMQKYVFLPQDYSLCSAFQGTAVPTMTPVDELDASIIAAEIERRRNETLDVIEAMPMEAYQKALEDMLIIHANNHMIDPSKPNNILLNPRDKRFGWIDLNHVEKHRRPANSEKVFPLYLPYMLTAGVQQNTGIGKRMLKDPDPFNTDLNEREQEVLSRSFLKFLSALEASPSANWHFPYENYFSVDRLQQNYGFKAKDAERVKAKIETIIARNESPPGTSGFMPLGRPSI